MKGEIQNQALQLENFQKRIVVLDRNIALFKKILIVVIITMLGIFIL
jgi:hypothetical protein